MKLAAQQLVPKNPNHKQRPCISKRQEKQSSKYQNRFNQKENSSRV